MLYPKISKFFLKDPGLYSNLGNNILPNNYIYTRFNDCLMRTLAKKNAFVSLILKAKVGDDALPPYLKEEGMQIIKKRLYKINIVTHELISFLEDSPSGSFDAFSISDVASFLNKEDYQRLLSAIYHAAAPNAKFCLRQLMSNYDIPKEDKRFQRDPSLEKEIEQEDDCFVYRYMIGHICK